MRLSIIISSYTGKRFAQDHRHKISGLPSEELAGHRLYLQICGKLRTSQTTLQLWKDEEVTRSQVRSGLLKRVSGRHSFRHSIRMHFVVSKEDIPSVLPWSFTRFSKYSAVGLRINCCILRHVPHWQYPLRRRKLSLLASLLEESFSLLLKHFYPVTCIPYCLSWRGLYGELMFHPQWWCNQGKPAFPRHTRSTTWATYIEISTSCTIAFSPPHRRILQA